MRQAIRLESAIPEIYPGELRREHVRLVSHSTSVRSAGRARGEERGQLVLRARIRIPCVAIASPTARKGDGEGEGGKDYRALSMSPVISRFVEGNLRGRPADAIRDRAGLKLGLRGRDRLPWPRDALCPPRSRRPRLGKIVAGKRSGFRSIPFLPVGDSSTAVSHRRDIRCRAVDPLRILCSSRETGTGLNRRSREPSLPESRGPHVLRVLGIRMWHFYIDRHP